MCIVTEIGCEGHNSYDVMTAVIIVGIVKSFPFHSLMFVLNLAFAPFKSVFPLIPRKVSTSTGAQE